MMLDMSIFEFFCINIKLCHEDNHKISVLDLLITHFLQET